VVREDEGVGTLRGSIDGDRDVARPAGNAGCIAGGQSGTGMAFRYVDIRFARRASVGLTVLAPNPVAWEAAGGMPGMTDIRLVADDGVVVPRPPCPGDLVAKDADRLCSGVIIGVDRWICGCLAGGCIDFAFAARAVARRAPSAAVFVEPRRLDRPMLPVPGTSALAVLDARLGRRRCEALAAKSVSMPPGPIDLRGVLAALLPEIGGYWLCRRVRTVRGACGGSMLPEAKEAIEAVEDILLCRVEVLCLLTIELLLVGRWEVLLARCCELVELLSLFLPIFPSTVSVTALPRPLGVGN
jgi:hypothetical protein